MKYMVVLFAFLLSTTLLYSDEIPKKKTNIFRLGEETDRILVRSDLAKLIIDSGCS